ncbi:MAG: phage tail protein [Turicibacter sp.]|nr:phage tail protein [Turicibacter sp.]
MYSLRLDGQIFYTPDIEEFALLDAKFHQEMNMAENLTFTMPTVHPFYDDFKKLTSIVELYDNAFLMGRMRVINIEYDLFNNMTVTCEGVLAYLNDTVVRPYDYAGGVVPYFKMLLDQHNAQVPTNKRIALGTVTVTDVNDFIWRADSTYPSTWNVVEEKCLKLLGGFLRMRYPAGNATLDWLVDTNLLSTQRITFENLLDLKLEQRGEDICTAIVPLGASIEPEGEFGEEDSDGEKHQVEDAQNKRVTIETVNPTGFDYIQDPVAVAKYGFILKTVVWDDVFEPDNLFRKAKEYLVDATSELHKLSLTAVDLEKAGYTADQFRFLEYVDFETPTSEGRLLVIKLETDLLNPENNVLTLGSDYGTFSFNGVRNGLAKVVTEIGNQTNGSTVTSWNTIKKLWAMIRVFENKIEMEVGNQTINWNDFFEWWEGERTLYVQDSNSFNFIFENYTYITQIVEGEIENSFHEQSKYIRFINGVIHIGAVGEPMEVQITNDKLSFFNNGIEVAYVSNDRLFINDATINNSLDLGNFRFQPRPNGNLSFYRKPPLP